METIRKHENRSNHQDQERTRQFVDFSGIRYGNIMPSKVDGFIEKGNEAFVFYQVKHADAAIPKGQELALTRMVDVLTSTGKKAVLFLCRHNVDNPEDVIDAADAKVESLYFNGEWTKANGRTLKEMTDRFMEWAVPFMML